MMDELATTLETLWVRCNVQRMGGYAA
jgi:hypothetical protein